MGADRNVLNVKRLPYVIHVEDLALDALLGTAFFLVGAPSIAPRRASRSSSPLATWERCGRAAAPIRLCA